MRRHKFKIIDKLECFSQNPVMIKCTIFIKAWKQARLFSKLKEKGGFCIANRNAPTLYIQIAQIRLQHVHIRILLVLK